MYLAGNFAFRSIKERYYGLRYMKSKRSNFPDLVQLETLKGR